MPRNDAAIVLFSQLPYSLDVSIQSRKLCLVTRPNGDPQATDFELRHTELPRPKSGEVIVAVKLLSLEPAMRGWMDDRPSYIPPVKLGEEMRATGIGEVLVSHSPRFRAGDFVMGSLGAQTHSLIAADRLRAVDASTAPLDVQLGLLSTSGLTAYFGVTDVGQVKPGETFVVSGAAGSVGSIAGQVARILGCRVVGVAGGPAKCDYLRNTLNFDAAVDYKTDGLQALMAAACPTGIDVYFDNVGNPVLDAALRHINQRARVVLCGAISQYNATGGVNGPRNYIALIVKRASMRGFIVFDYHAQYAEACAKLLTWWGAGLIHYRADTLSGLENFHPGLMRLFRGENHGKSLLSIE